MLRLYLRRIRLLSYYISLQTQQRHLSQTSESFMNMPLTQIICHAFKYSLLLNAKICRTY